MRIVTDNAKTNVGLFKKIAGNDTSFCLPHPLDHGRVLFLSYDYTHLLKNIRNQWIERRFVINNATVSFDVIKKNY